MDGRSFYLYLPTWSNKEFALKAVNTGREKKIGTWFLPLGKYVLVPLALVALIAGAVLGGIG